MRKSRRKRLRNFTLLLFLFISLGYLALSSYARSLVSKALVRLLPSGREVLLRKVHFSFSDGVVLQGLEIKGKGEGKVGKLMFRKEKGGIFLRIEDAELDWEWISSLTKILFSRREGKIPLPISGVNIWMKNIELNLSGSQRIEILEASIAGSRKGVNFFLRTNFKLLPLTLEGYLSQAGESFFLLQSSNLPSVLTASYNLREKELNSRVYWQGRSYSFNSGLSFEKGDLILRGVRISKFYLAGPIHLNLREKMYSSWEISTPRFEAEGKLDFQREEEGWKLYLKVQHASFQDYKLVTNFYLSYFNRLGRLEFKSLGSILNNQPLSELEFRLRFLPSGILIESLKYQAGLELAGYLDYQLNFNLNGEFDKFSPRDFLSLLPSSYLEELDLKDIEGRFSWFSYRGVNLIEISLQLPQGRIGDINFQEGKIYLVGESNILEFINSQVLVNNTPMSLRGSLDLSKFPSPQMWARVYLVPSQTSFPLGEVSSEDKFGQKSFSLGARLNESVKLDYNVEFSEEENYNKNEIALEIEGEPDLKLRLREEEGIMSLEKNIKF